MKHIALTCLLGLSMGIPAISALPAHACIPHPDYPNGCDDYNVPKILIRPGCLTSGIQSAQLIEDVYIEPTCEIPFDGQNTPIYIDPISNPIYTNNSPEPDPKIPSISID